MFGFLIKKSFFDMWDNLIRIVILNLGFILAFALIIYFPLLFRDIPVLFFMALGIGMGILFVYAGVVSNFTARIADYSKPEFKDFLPTLKATYPTSLLFALVNLVLVILFQVAFRVYGGIQSFIGPLASSFLFWVLIFWILAFQYFFSVQARLDRNFRKIIKKMFLLLLDNPLFTVGLFIGTLVTAAVSVFTALLLPGIATIFLWWNVALKLRLYKYDYLEEHPDARRNIPWDALLTEDRERVGKRTLKGMIFPWKE
ncbi:MAG: hypothetical protein JSV89_03480 [Spirochaetaceae bacterium]|nr:MAG: hypothetical protein JSV89_03480 [Spirochaetaceae bacterium]